MSQRSEIAELFADVREHVLYLGEIGVEILSADLPEFAKADAALPRPLPTAARAESPAELSKPGPGRPAVVPQVPKKPTAAPKARPGSRLKALPSLAERPDPVVLKSSATSAPTASG